MTNEIKVSEALKTLQDFLINLFQFESVDLDFGIYKILNYKKAEVEDFINRLLTEKVREQLNVLANVENEKLNAQVQELEKTANISKYLEAVNKNDTGRITIYEEDFKTDIEHYKLLKSQFEHQINTNNAEPLIYNHLTIFFSRYYDKGDFVSKRRYGKSEKYVVPYNGEETYFHWANADQYYIKSSEHFSKYSFKVLSPTGHFHVHFKLRELQEENGNAKSENNKFFIISDNPVETSENEVNIYFEYRTLYNGEKDNKGKNQDELNVNALPIITKALGKHMVLTELNKSINAKTKLAVELNRYTARNKYDFFIHKNLKGFLNRELDFYIKSELLKLDDLTIFDTVTHYEKIKLQFNIVKTFKNIASTIIDFISQVEDFQKKLWEKKKFVISTEYVITLDKLANFTSKEFTSEILAEVLKNKKQLDEWENLFGDGVLSKWKKLKPEDVINEDGTYRKLPIDTAYFDSDFKWKVICKISELQCLEEVCDGLVVHSDNFHGLNLLLEKYQQRVKVQYIDPPYNTNASEIIYKNSFKNSSWIAMIIDRIQLGRLFMKDNGILCVTIDDVQLKELSMLLHSVYGASNIAGTIAIRVNPSGRPNEDGLAIAHEYALFVKATEKSKIRKLPRTDAQLKRYDEKDEESIYEWRNFRREGSNSNREDGKRQWYPIYSNKESGNIRVPKMNWNEETELWEIQEKSIVDEVIVYPITDEGIEKNWRWSEENVRADCAQFECRVSKDNSVQVYYKFRPNTEGVTPLTFWADAKYSATEHGTKVLKDLFFKSKFSYPKSIWAVKDCLYIMGADRNCIILDYFPGSGTTFHSTQLLNRDDDGKRKTLLIEQGNYVYDTIIPRIKKIAYSFEWELAKPLDESGLGVFIKYQRLEQYEEALENIAFNPNINTAEAQLQFKDYIPKYFLHFETSESNTLLNLDAFKNPFAYSLKVFDSYNYNEQVVDVIETFNYLAGIHVNSYKQEKHQKRNYIFVTGNDRQLRKVVVVWRDATDLDFTKDRDFIKQTLKDTSYDMLYVNNQCAIEGAVMIEEIFKSRMT